MLRGRGCYYCGRKTNVVHTIEKKHKIAEQKAIEYFSNYSDIEFIGLDYETGRAGAKFICLKHNSAGIQNRVMSNLKRSKFICYECWKEDIRLQNFKEKIHSKNSDIVITSSFIKTSEHVSCECKKCGNKWDVRASVLLDHCSCPKCRNAMSSSERAISSILMNNNIKFEQQKRYPDCINIRPLPFDFYLTDYNVLIEYDGEQHYKIIPRTNSTYKELLNELDNIKRRDSIKTKYCEDNGIPLIRIPYWEKDNMECFLFDKLSNFNIKIA